MDTDEVIKLVDGVYKNILEKFNPGARQLINAGKAYLKALHGAAAASRLFNESLLKIASNAQHGGTNDIGAALMNIVEVYKGIQDQQMNILKAFYVDLLVPLETNLEKDTKVVQFEQKKFLQNHKIRTESYSKAAATMKKQRKKKNSPQSTDKDIKNIQALEEQKNKLDAFCEQSFKNAMTQERRRYGFVLERQCSLAKHWMAYYTAGKGAIEANLDNWSEIAASRETLPPHIDNVFAKRMAEKLRDDEENASVTSALRKTHSVDASCLDMRSLGDLATTAMCMPRAKSEFNLTSSSPHDMRVLSDENWDQRPVVKALYAYISSGENQLSFLEGDRIALVGNRAKGWQFGENLRTQMFGWFPIAYTESENFNQKENIYDSRPSHHMNGNHNKYKAESSVEVTEESVVSRHRSSYHSESSPTRMFGDTLMFRQSKQYRRNNEEPKPGPPPALPAPVPAPIVPAYKSNISQSRSFCSPVGPPLIEKRRPGPTNNYSRVVTNKQKPNREGVTSASLHSSNDSGFANEPPPQPEVDYSDEEQSNRVPIRSPRSARNYHEANGRSAQAYRNSESASTLQTRYKTQNGSSNTLQRPQQNGNNSTINRPQSLKNLGDETTDTGYHTTERKGNLIKRTKSFWKFGKSDDILEGMAMWRHRDLVSIEKDQNGNEVSESTQKKNIKNQNMTNGNGVNMKRRTMESTDQATEDESIYGVQQSRSSSNIMSTPQKMNQSKNSYYNGNGKNTSGTEYNGNYQDSKIDTKDYRRRQQMYYEQNTNAKNSHEQLDMNDDDKSSLDDNDDTETLTMHNSNFFDDESVEEIVMKTVKRHEILKQYDTSGTDSEPHSSSSDAYDCIVVDDHLVRRARSNRRKDEDKMEFKTFRDNSQNGGGNMDTPPTTGPMLPRTKLSKVPNPIHASDVHSNRTSDHQQSKDMNGHTQNQKMSKDRNSKTYGPWYDLWGKDPSSPQKA